ncbi:MAG: hypothetical protein JWO38_2754 [Gemmataceae bacterium]|nr:hypothetical protein [Gemmataceae bacterium]
MISTWLLAAALGPGSHDPTSAGDPPSPTAVHRIDGPRFRIPLRSEQIHDQEVTRIRLLMSADRGRTWKLAAVATPNTGWFDFRAEKSGEHWFTVQYERKTGALDPADPRDLFPMLKVQVGPVKASVLEEEAGQLDEDLNEVELALIRKQLNRLTGRDGLTPGVGEEIDRLRQRLTETRNRLRAQRDPLIGIAPPVATSGWTTPPPSRDPVPPAPMSVLPPPGAPQLPSTPDTPLEVAPPPSPAPRR